MSHIVVVGAGQAGSSLVAKLRAEGFDGEVTLIGVEPVPPYQRPPLSKAYLLGDMTKERLYLRPAEFYADQNITLRTSVRVTGIDPVAKIVTLEGSEEIAYDQLAFTTGSHPNTLPAAIGGTLDNVYTVRDLQDADAMAPHFQAGKRALIVGGGYIGLEAAAVAAKKGVAVTLVEMGERILQRVACAQTSDYFRALHSDHGVDIRESTGLARLIGDGAVTGAEFTDGSTLDVDFVIVGVGIKPASVLAEASGIEMAAGGIGTDAFGRTNDPAIWAAGDCASLPYRGTQLRLESVQNAIDQAEAVARNMLGAETEYRAKPWFWSDQYDVKLQIAGLNIGYDNIVVRAGDKDGSVSHWYFRGDELLAVDAMNDPRNYIIGKRLIEAGKSPAAAAIADPETDMKGLLSA